MTTPRVALLGISHETNRFAPVMPDHEFVTWRGAAIVEESRAERTSMKQEMRAFVREMDKTGIWEPVPLVLMHGGDFGPVRQGLFDSFLAEVSTGLKAALPLDAVYLSQHTGGITTEDEDSEGTLFAAVRAIVGPDAKIVVTSDLHGSVSARMVESVDLLITYLTNPHEDMLERGVEAAQSLRELLAGTRAVSAFLRVPMLTWTIPQETVAGNPFGDLVIKGQALLAADQRLMNVSLFASFACTNVPKVGLSIVVTAREDQAAADSAVSTLAQMAWADRGRYQPNFSALDDAVRRAVAVGLDPAVPPLLFVDFADNPGGGGGGNTVTVLRAFHAAGVQGAVFGIHTDAKLVADAHAAGVGQKIHAVFNQAPDSAFAERFEVDATVIALTDGCFLSTRHPKGKEMRLGASCALDVGGTIVLLITNRQQILSDECIEHFDIDVDRARSIVVKSRLHYKPGFRHRFDDDRIVEVDVPGQASPVLSRWNFDRLSRPIYPLDPDMTWSVPELVAG